MTELQNPKHEIFAQMVANGNTQENAYLMAGYSEKGARQSASRLLTNANISSRVQELQEEARNETETSLISIINELNDVIKRAKCIGHYGAASRAIMYKAKLLGFF